MTGGSAARGFAASTRRGTIANSTCQTATPLLESGCAHCITSKIDRELGFVAERSHAKPAAKSSCRVVRLRAVVIHEHLAIATVAVQRAAQRSHVGRSL